MILKIIIGIVGISIFQYLKSRFCYRNSKSYGQEARLPFKTIASIYHVNHDRWKYTQVLLDDSDIFAGWSKVLLYNAYDFYDCEEIYWPSMERYNDYNREDNRIRKDIIRIHLSYFDWLKLRLYYFFKRSPTKANEAILKSAQRDIDKLRTIAQNQIKAASDDISEVAKRLEEERSLQV